MTTPILFLSGAGLPAWIWDDVRAALPGESRVAPRSGGTASLTDHASAALDTAAGWERFHVVAHSVGGVVASALLHAAPQRVAGLVAVTACVPAPGESFVRALPFPQRHVLALMVRLLGTRPPEKVLRNGLCSGLDADVADRVVADFSPESKRLYLDPVPAGVFPTPSAYVLTTGDAELPPALQERYAARLGGAVVRMDTGHLPMLEQPARLAAVVTAQVAAVA
jgi:pimeloyl-ACP methyl ester carboxylesterase